MIKIFSHHNTQMLEDEVNKFIEDTKAKINNLSISQTDIVVNYTVKPKLLERIRSLFRRK